MLLLTFLGNFSQEFEVLTPQSRQPAEDELSASAAFTRMKAALREIHVIWPDGLKQLYLETTAKRRIWFCDTSSEATIEIDAKTGFLVLYSDGAMRNVKSTVPYENIFRTPEAVRERFLEIIRDGLAPPGTRLVKMGLANTASEGYFWPSVSCVTSLFWKDRKVNGCYGQYSFDIRTGKVIDLTQWYEYEIAVEEPTLALERCVELATSAYEARLAGRKANPYDPLKPATLCYGATLENPKVKTIAYTVKFGKDGVIIDATNGKTLAVSIYPRPG